MCLCVPVGGQEKGWHTPEWAMYPGGILFSSAVQYCQQWLLQYGQPMNMYTTQVRLVVAAALQSKYTTHQRQLQANHTARASSILHIHNSSPNPSTLRGSVALAPPPPSTQHTSISDPPVLEGLCKRLQQHICNQRMCNWQKSPVRPLIAWGGGTGEDGDA